MATTTRSSPARGMLESRIAQKDDVSMALKRQVDTHQRTLKCAMELFLAKGYAKTSVNDIVGAAKISRATFYLYFGGKEAVLREYMSLIWDESTLLFERFADLPDLSESSIHAWLNDYLETTLRYESIIRLVTNTLRRELTAQAAARESRFVDAFIGHSSVWKRFRADEARCLAYLLICQLQHGTQEFITGRLPIDRHTFLTTLTEIWIATLQMPPASQRSRSRTAI